MQACVAEVLRLCVYMCVCVLVCMRYRERKSDSERERVCLNVYVDV